MIYKKQTSKPITQAVEAMQAEVKAHGFGVLHTYDFKQTLADKGFPLANGCVVMEVCNPKQAAGVLAADMRMNMALPCRVSVYTDGGKTWIGMIRPVPMLAMLSNDPALAAIAGEVEETLTRIIDEVR